jgi:TPP-dependent pyruvate/acetoin dehydrogenase alpha subunit
MIGLYKVMKKIRSFEETVFRLTTEGLVQGSVHFYSGQEAVAAGVFYCLEEKDYIMSHHRCHGHFIARGSDMKKMLAELLGRKDGYCGGMGGTMHLAAPDIGMMGTNGLVGAGIPIATGLSYACDNFEKGKIVVSFFGDGAINTGAFHESVNLASLWKLPIVFICENNQYAISTSVEKSSAVINLSERAKAYGIKGFNVDGNDIMKVLETTGDAVEMTRSGKGPVLIVFNTYRQMGHSIHDPRTYRTEAEEKRWKKKDPILHLENILRSEKAIDDKVIKEINNKIKNEIDDAVDFAKNSKKPEPEDMAKYVYA